ncbi:MAG: hypothetical protein ACLQBB_07240 [Solirubrobacteraceae bacterium]
MESSSDTSGGRRRRLPGLWASLVGLVRSIRDDDQAAVEAILRLSRSHRALAPLAFTVGAFALLLAGVRVLFTNRRLLLIQILPAMWIWLAMADIKAHVLHGKSFHVMRGPILIPVNLAIIAITIGAYFLNAVFAFAIVGPRPPVIRDAFAKARARLRAIVLIGGVIGLLLGISATVVTRAGRPWFTLSLGIVTGLMMVTYVAVPSRLIGIAAVKSKRNKLTASAISSGVSVTVCTPPYVLERLGLLMLGSNVLLIPGIFVLVLGGVLQVGTTGAVRAVKMSVSLLPEPEAASEPAAAPDR